MIVVLILPSFNSQSSLSREPNGIPILFIPGNAGGKYQVRSLE
jgi:hypothetical protein